MGASASAQGGWSPADLPDLSGKVALVTGATSGVGLETARELARKKCHVVLAGRSTEKLERALHDVRATVPEAACEPLLVDLGDLRSVERAAADVRDRFPELNVLVNNAGVAMSKPGKTPQGFDLVLGTNHVGPSLLTELLLPLLRKGKPSRVVFLSAAAEALAPPIDWADVGGALAPHKGMPEVCTSKLFAAMYARALQLRFGGEGISFFAVHPGLIRSDLYNKPEAASGPVARVIRWVTFWLGAPPEKGALPVLYCAAAEGLEGRADEPGMFGPDNWMRTWVGARPIENPQYHATGLCARLRRETRRELRGRGGVAAALLPREDGGE